jgi:4-amino-4-deoxy-L-arabinose transferase-like glycosyltransferase
MGGLYTGRPPPAWPGRAARSPCGLIAPITRVVHSARIFAVSVLRTAPDTAPASRDVSGRQRALAALAVAALTALLVLPPLGRHLIAYSGEARMALLARDMLERRTLFHARVEGQHYRNKPPLYPWSIALVSWGRGRVTEATAQAPVAVAAIASAVFTCLLGSRLWGPRAGLWAGVILATSAGFFSHSQVLLPDMLVTAFTTAATYAFWRWVTAPPGRLAGAAFYAALAFAVFAKGPVGLLPLAAAALWLVSEHGARGLTRLASPAGLLIFAGVTALWLGPFLAAGTQTFGETVLWGDWLSWYLGLPSPRRVGEFLVDALVGFLPWSFVLPLALGHAVRDRRDPATRWALVSCLVPLAVIVLSRNRLPIYLLPVYPGAALLVAWWADTRAAAPSRLARAVGSLAPLAVVAALVVAPFVPDVKESEIFAVPGFAWRAIPLGIGAVLLGLVFFRALRDGRPTLLVWGGGAVMAVLLALGVSLADQAIRTTQDFRVVAAALARHAAGGEVRLFSASLLLPVDFYYGRQLVRMQTIGELDRFLARPDRPIVLIDRRYWRDFQRQFPPDLRVLERIPIQGQELVIAGRAPA